MLVFAYMDRRLLVDFLDVHLESVHSVYFEKRNEQTADGIERPVIKNAEWFESNKAHPMARRPLYSKYAMYSTRNC